MVTPSVPPQRLPVNLVRSGRKQPQREHCVPGCGWWGCLHNALLRNPPPVCINFQCVSVFACPCLLCCGAKHPYAAISRGVFVFGDQLWLWLKSVRAGADLAGSVIGDPRGVLTKGVAQRLSGRGCPVGSCLEAKGRQHQRPASVMSCEL